MANHPAKGGVFTEVDIVRHVVKDLIESYAKDQEIKAQKHGDDNIGHVDQSSLHEQKKTVFKLYMRIWITASRQVRTLCEKNEGRPVELKHIGFFYKKKDQNFFSFVPNSDLTYDAKLRIAEHNAENQPVLPAEVRVFQT